MCSRGEKLAYIFTLYSSKPEFQIDDSEFILFFIGIHSRQQCHFFVNDVIQHNMCGLHSVKELSRSTIISLGRE